MRIIILPKKLCILIINLIFLQTCTITIGLVRYNYYHELSIIFDIVFKNKFDINIINAIHIRVKSKNCSGTHNYGNRYYLLHSTYDYDL